MIDNDKNICCSCMNWIYEGASTGVCMDKRNKDKDGHQFPIKAYWDGCLYYDLNPEGEVEIDEEYL